MESWEQKQDCSRSNSEGGEEVKEASMKYCVKMPNDYKREARDRVASRRETVRADNVSKLRERGDRELVTQVRGEVIPGGTDKFKEAEWGKLWPIFFMKEEGRRKSDLK